MLRKLLSTCVSPLASRSESYDGANKVEAFYSDLSEDLKNLGNLVGVDSPSFSLESLRLALDFVRSLHSKVLELVEDQLNPVSRTSGGMHILNMYMDVSKKLLDMCTFVKSAIWYLESYQMSFEVALSSLSSAVDSLSVGGDDSKAMSSLEACRSELKKLDRKKNSQNLWAETFSNFNEDSARDTHKKQEMPIRRSVTIMSPTQSVDPKALHISQLILNVQDIAIFISSLIVWVLSESSEKFASPVNLDTGVNGKVDWSGPLLRLTEKMKSIELEGSKEAENSHHANRLREFEDIKNLMYQLCEQIEGGLKNSEKEDKWVADSSSLLTQTFGKLAEILKCSETLAMQSRNTFSDISSSRKRLLAVSEGHLSRSPTI